MKMIDERFASAAKILADRMEFWATNKRAVDAVFDAIGKAFPDAEFDVNPGSFEVSIRGRVGDLMGGVAILEENGFHGDNELPVEKVSYWSGNFYNDAGLRIWFYWSSTTCQRVQVGTKMQEVAVYELRCSDEEGA